MWYRQLTKSLARVTGEVVGVDASETMLSQARARFADSPHIRYVCGDFRSFAVDRQFGAVVCGFNSINYLGSMAELKAMFHHVAKHLLPGGCFVFDSMTEYGMLLSSGLYLHVQTSRKRFVMRFEYDRAQRKQTVVIQVPEGTEIHRRVPIDPRDVKEACQDSGLVLEDYFSSAFFPGWWYTGPTCFFVLRRRCAD